MKLGTVYKLNGKWFVRISEGSLDFPNKNQAESYAWFYINELKKRGLVNEQLLRQGTGLRTG